jgi:hypothetical protein
MGEGLSVVEAGPWTAVFGDEAGLKAGDLTLRVYLDLVDPHVVDDPAVGGEID